VSADVPPADLRINSDDCKSLG